MHDSSLLVGLDIGTSGVRAVAFTPEGKPVAEGRASLKSQYLADGGIQQQPEEWWQASVQALRQLAASLQDTITSVAGLALTGQCPTLALLDPIRGPIGPGLLYQDNRANAEAEMLLSHFGSAAIHTRTGQAASAFYILPKLLWLQGQSAHLPLEKLTLVQPRDLVGWYLTDRVVTDPTHAATTLAYDLRTQTWAEDWLLELDLPQQSWPEIVPSSSVQGYLSADAARLIGFTAGLPIITGAADSICAAYAAGALEPGILCEVTGTSTCLHMTTHNPVVASAINIYPHILPGHWYTENGLNTTGGALLWLATLLQRTPDQLIEEASQVEPGSNGLFFMPHLSGGERDDAGRHGAFVGLRLGSSSAQLGRALLEGVAYALRQHIEMLEAAGRTVTCLISCGGSARSMLWAQIKADILERPVMALTHTEITTWGAALLVARTLGIDTPIAGQHVREVIPHTMHSDLYRRSYQQFCRFEEAMNFRATGEKQRSITHG